MMGTQVFPPQRGATAELAPLIQVVGNDPAVREALALMIRSAGWQAETFSCAHEFLASSRKRDPSCVVLDFTFADIDGLEVQRRLAQDDASVPVIFTGCATVPATVRAMKAGAVDVLAVPFDEASALAAIENAIEVGRGAAQRQAHLRGLQACYASLTPREREVMALVTAGRLNKQTAGELGISEITVKAHRGKMMRKMNARSLAVLVDMALRLRGAAPGIQH